eukprot:CAMPEP_0184458404 /NCGR_PEP_ID=MMETSP0740-20130409/33196_1 /TAXON_ID=385413 /ORGANISM="Thalassiosira miniscula, Strain CCMP1093" /LENGTH=166 /DNA_ID=CAMNT_0026831055 /DNA_START=181 /DNA_END=677 /DNA_ORIENTATION=+
MRDGLMSALRFPKASMIIAAGLFVAACGGGGGGSSVPPVPPTSGGGSGGGGGAPPVEPSSKIDSELEASRFLARATFGGTKSEIASLNGRDAADWLASEFSKSASLTMPDLLAQPRDENGRLQNQRINELYWDHLVTANDQVRQRMAFALSQILVYSDAADSDQPT